MRCHKTPFCYACLDTYKYSIFCTVRGCEKKLTREEYDAWYEGCDYKYDDRNRSVDGTQVKDEDRFDCDFELPEEFELQSPSIGAVTTISGGLIDMTGDDDDDDDDDESSFVVNHVDISETSNGTSAVFTSGNITSGNINSMSVLFPEVNNLMTPPRSVANKIESSPSSRSINSFLESPGINPNKDEERSKSKEMKERKEQKVTDSFQLAIEEAKKNTNRQFHVHLRMNKKANKQNT